jgi:hypothetical protein
MAIKAESLQKLLVRLNIANDTAKAKELIESQEEKEIAIPDTVKVYADPEWGQVKENLKNEGIQVGKELLIKDMKGKAGLEYDGKDPEKFLSEYKALVLKDGNVSVDEKVKAREKTIEELRGALKLAQDKEADALSKMTGLRKDTDLLRLLPKDRDDRFGDEHWLSLVKQELQFAEEEGKAIVKDRNGNVIKDAQFNPVTVETALTDLFKTKNWTKEAVPNPKGPGFEDSTKVPGTINNMKEFQDYCKAQSLDIKGQQAQAKLAEVTKANKDFSFE